MMAKMKRLKYIKSQKAMQLNQRYTEKIFITTYTVMDSNSASKSEYAILEFYRQLTALTGNDAGKDPSVYEPNNDTLLP